MGTVGSLFTGCGGLDLGLEQAGWRTLWECENDEACRRVLARRMPDVPVHPDVRNLPADLEPVDLLAGGFPCQDLSYAGRGRGLDGDRSALWFDMARAVRMVRPRLVLVENVPGLATRGLGRVLYDLAEAGYVGSWIRLGAADLGAPHRRERIFILAADADGGRLEGGGVAQPRGIEGARGGVTDGRDEVRQLEHAPAWGPYEPAIRRWEHALGRRAPRPTDDRGRLNPAFVEWMLGYPDGWTDGERRTHRLRMLGNSVQVQCGEYVGAILMEALHAGA